jgi:hypothetical protein
MYQVTEGNTTMTKTMQRLATLGAAIALAGAAAGSASADRGAFHNWHVHDGASGTDASGLVHRGLALFPAILTGGNIDAYLTDPAYCPDATDKFLLPNGANGEFPAAGICTTDAYVIHLRAIPSGNPTPTGWQPSAFLIQGAEVYYRLTPR